MVSGPADAGEFSGGRSEIRPEVRSGGQTGVDRAGLDAAMAWGLKTGGWCPRGRLAEDGVIPQRYRLRETPLSDYAQRTGWNVRDSEATLILHRGALTGGTELTRRLAESMGRPCRCVDLATAPDPRESAAWIRQRAPSKLNIAGPRESQHPGIGLQARRFLELVFRSL